MFQNQNLQFFHNTNFWPIGTTLNWSKPCNNLPVAPNKLRMKHFLKILNLFLLLTVVCYFCDWIMTNDYWGWLVTHAWCYSLDWCWWQEWDNAGWALCLHNFLVVNTIHDWFGNCYINVSTSAQRTSDPIWYKDTIDWNWIY